MSFLPALVVIAMVIFWLGRSGGYGDDVWYPSGLVALALLGVTVVAGGRGLPEPRWARIGLVGYATLVAFNYLSIVWAPSRESALAAANEMAVYLLVAWVLALVRWTPIRLAVILGLWSMGVFVFCGLALEHATAASNLTTFFVDGRFAPPMQYSNATGALAVMGLWPALIFSSRRELPFPLRGLALGIAVFLAGFVTLPQSRAAILGLILSAPVALLVSTQRVRLAVRMLVVGGALAVTLPRGTAMNQAIDGNLRVQASLHHAARGIVETSLAALAVGLLLAGIEVALGRLRPVTAAASAGRRLRGRLGRPHPAVSVGCVMIIVIAAAIVARPPVVHLVDRVVSQGRTDASVGSARITSLSPEERLDYYRVSLHMFSTSPLYGIGAGNFGRAYDARRRFAKHSQYTHDLPLRVLAETGVIGTALFFFTVLALAAGMVRGARRRVGLERACVAAAFALSAYFLVHSCLDWVDEFPALAVPAIGFPLAAIALTGPEPSPGGRFALARRIPSGRWRRLLAATVALVCGLAVFVALGSAYLAQRYETVAFAGFQTNSGQAYRDLGTARSLDPLGAEPITGEGTIALYLGDRARSARAFQRSLQNEDNWFPHMELTLLDASAGRFTQARRELAQTRRLDVHDPLTDDLAVLLAHRTRIDPISFNDQIVREGQAGIQSPIR